MHGQKNKETDCMCCCAPVLHSSIHSGVSSADQPYSRKSLMSGGMFSMLLHLYFLTCWPKPYINYSCRWQKKSGLGIVSVATCQMSHRLSQSINCSPVFKKESSFNHKIKF